MQLSPGGRIEIVQVSRFYHWFDQATVVYVGEVGDIASDKQLHIYLAVASLNSAESG